MPAVPSSTNTPSSQAWRAENDPYRAAKKYITEKSFEAETSDYIESYLVALRGNWHALTVTVSRTGLLLVALVVVFYLLSTPGAISGVALGPFEIQNPEVIRKAIPVVFAYLFYELALLGQRWENTRDLFRLLMERQHEALYESNMEILLQPRMISLIGHPDHAYDFLGRQVRFVRFHQTVSAGVVPVLVMLVLPVAFEIDAYRRLFERSIDVATVGGAVLSGVIVLLTLSVYSVQEKSLDMVRQ
jgi:hypothetical protein